MGEIEELIKNGLIEFMEINKGHEVRLKGKFLFWVCGSIQNAKKELKLYL